MMTGVPDEPQRWLTTQTCAEPARSVTRSALRDEKLAESNAEVGQDVSVNRFGVSRQGLGPPGVRGPCGGPPCGGGGGGFPSG